MDYGNDLTRLLRCGKNSSATRLFLVSFMAERHLSFTAQLGKGSLSFRVTSQFTGCKKYNEHACLPLDNRQIILGHEDVDGNSCIYIKILDKLLKSWNVSDLLENKTWDLL